ncbi:Nmad5 family putative nucleotide modification protein [Methylobacterium brachiatum]|uniref:Nmad5 family putative nucleotide modification protein n=1 Tax=Methylobacterium brachiatum TaxID=269660 RepID=UPI0008E3F293|nr:Nmad5 family putative nucleotide modification protein [Methylobacterium brachiatum]SFJ68625.1 hypothetical protein SAMN02799642_05177 [Methylobacterium brachiatum]
MTKTDKIPSVRLTNQDRDNVVKAAIQASFTDRHRALKVEEDRLARRCYDAVFSEKVRKAVAVIPAGWLRADTCLRFNVGGMNIRLDVAGEGLRVPSQQWNCERLGNVADESLIAEVQAFLQARDGLKAEREKAQQSLKALLYSVTTLRALRDLWPEGEPFFRGLASKTGAPGLPAPQIAELNAMLGLPAPEAV